MDHPGENFEVQETYEEQEENYEGQEGNFEGQENFHEEEQEEAPGVNGDTHEQLVEEEEEEEEEEQAEEEADQENNVQTGNGENAEEIGADSNDSQEKVEEKRWPGWPGENAFRMIVPVHKVGAVIGHKGDIIKKMSEETKARIRVLNSPPGVQERVVLVSAKEEPDFPVSPAMEALFRVHKRIVDGLDSESEQSAASTGSMGPTRLLVPGVQAATIIGKQGATIKLIQEGSDATVRVSENVPPVALYDDRIVEIQGEPAAMHKALELITSYLRKFLVDRSVIPLFEAQTQQQQNIQREQQMPGQQPWGPPPQNYPPPYSGSGPGYGGPHHYIPPPPSHDNYYPPPELPPRYEKPPPYVAPAYAREQPPPPGAHSSAAQLAPSAVTQVPHHMQVPLSYVDAVIGADGANISYIRRASGATVTVQETRGVPGEMTVEMVGSSAQVQAAQQLIQNFMAEAATPGAAAAPAPAPAAAPAAAPVDSAYSSYPSYASTYAAGPPGTGAADPSAAYGSNYSTNYGY